MLLFILRTDVLEENEDFLVEVSCFWDFLIIVHLKRLHALLM